MNVLRTGTGSVQWNRPMPCAHIHTAHTRMSDANSIGLRAQCTHNPYAWRSARSCACVFAAKSCEVWASLSRVRTRCVHEIISVERFELRVASREHQHIRPFVRARACVCEKEKDNIKIDDFNSVSIALSDSKLVSIAVYLFIYFFSLLFLGCSRNRAFGIFL